MAEQDAKQIEDIELGNIQVQQQEQPKAENRSEDSSDIHADGKNKILDSPAVSFQWEDIKYSAKIPADRPWKRSPGRKQILKGLSGNVNAGESIAILGSSGAGKTTLLDILANRVVRSAWEGKIKINGDEEFNKYVHLIAYVPQADLIFAQLTVYESLLYSARLRLPSSMPDSEKKERVNSVIQMLGLTKCAHSRIGNDTGVRGISGGERRRTSIGMELVTAPSLLFMDEPTSGLDSASALNVAKIVKNLCSVGRTVVVTIHQPSTAILNCFSKVLFLAEGDIIYYGPVNQIANYFRGIDHPMPAQYNPADFILELVTKKQKKKQLDDLFKAYKSAGPQFIQQQNEAPEPAKKAAVVVDYNDHKKQRIGMVRQLVLLTYRSALNAIRSPDLFLARVGLFCFLSFLLGTLFWRKATGGSIKTVRDIEGFIIFSIAMASFTSLQALPIFLDEKAIYKRERGSGYYTLLPFTLSFLIVQIPILIILAILYSGFSYWVVGLATSAEAFFFFIITMFCVLITVQSFVLFLSAIVPNPGAGNALGSAILAVMFLFSGFFILPGDIPGYWIWIYWISLFHYPLEAAMQNEFLTVTKSYNVCEGLDSSSVQDCFRQGYALIDYLGLKHEINKWGLLGIMLGFAFLYRLGFYLLLKFIITPQRK